MLRIYTIRNFVFALLTAGLLPAPSLYAVQIAGSDSNLLITFPAGWKSSDTDDPDIVLKAERKNSSFSLTKLNQDLGNYYLKSRVREEIDSLRSKGFSISADIQRISIHGVAALYHMSYHVTGKTRRIGFFTYKGRSYALSASGIPSGEFSQIVFTIRAPGEKIVIRRPKKPKPITAKAPAAPFPDTSTKPADAERTALLVGFQPSAAGKPAPKAFAPVDEIRPPAVRKPAPWVFAPVDEIRLPPYIERSPIPFQYWLVAMVVWILGAFFSRLSASEIENPKLGTPPKEVPVDFFFPFIIQRSVSLGKLSYTVLSRQKQILYAAFNRTGTLMTVSFYSIILFHLLWSITGAAGEEHVITDMLLTLPGGQALASLPEMILLVPFAIGIIVWLQKKQTIRLMDHSGSLIFEAFPAFGTILIRDDKGKEVGRLNRLTPAIFGRHWRLTDEDNQPVLEIKDEHPKLLLLRKFFGHMGGAFQARYGIFVQERRAGFILRDPASVNRFQVHLEFAFSRLAHHALILICALYIESKDIDPIYPSLL